MDYRTFKLSDTKELRIVLDEDSSMFYSDLWENGVTFFSNHKHYSSEGVNKNINLESDIERSRFENEGYIIIPVYAYIHSGITVSLVPFNCRWDSGLFGHLAFKKGEFGENNQGLKGFIAQWNSLLSGEVYGYQIIETETCNLGHEHEEVIDSCYGFYGYDNDADMIKSMIIHFMTND
jgi:hypothetical protein